jgi:hypothetical protein
VIVKLGVEYIIRFTDVEKVDPPLRKHLDQTFEVVDDYKGRVARSPAEHRRANIADQVDACLFPALFGKSLQEVINEYAFAEHQDMTRYVPNVRQ